MKKIKLMLVAFMAILGVNAFAQAGSYSDATFTYDSNGATCKITGLNESVKGNIVTMNVPLTVLVNGAAQKVVEIGDDAFAGEAKLETVTIAKNVTKIGARAFLNCTALTTVTFLSESELESIDDFAFGGTTHLTSIDFTNCSKMKDFGTKTPFIYAGGNNPWLTAITLNGETTNIGTALANITKLQVNIKDTKIADLKGQALLNNSVITSLELPATVTDIANDALASTKVAELKINCSETDGKPTIGATGAKLTSLTFVGEFKGALAASSFTLDDGAVVTFGDFNGTVSAANALAVATGKKTGAITIGEVKSAIGNILINGAVGGDVTITKITTANTAVLINGAVTGNVTVGAIAGTAGLINGAVTGNVTTGAITAATVLVTGNVTGNVTTGAITAATKLITGNVTGNVEVGAITTAANLVGGNVTGTFKTGDIAATTGALITGNVGGAVTFGKITGAPTGLLGGTAGALTVGEISAAVPVTTFGQPTSITFGKITGAGSLTGEMAATTTLTTLTFGGAIDAANAFKPTAGKTLFGKATKLATVEFKGLVGNGLVVAGTFGDATDKAGSANTPTAPSIIKLTVIYKPEGIAAGDGDAPFDNNAFSAGATTDWVKLTTVGAVQTANGAIVDVDYDVAAPAAPELTVAIEVAKKDGDWSYGKFVNNTVYNFAISKADAIVYSGYVDESDNTIYLDQLQIVKGNYVVAAGQAVIIKNKTGETVNAKATNDASTERPGANQLVGYANSTPSYVILNALSNGGKKDVWAMAKPSSYNMMWKTFGDNITMPANTICIATPKSASGRLNVVWLDGSEDSTTAIQTVKKANAEDGAIYNLAGQKVNASYKGVVIKDGKKYIQK